MALLLIFATRYLNKPKLTLPPGPTPWPLIGSLHLLGTDPHRALADLARTYYGPLMSIRLGQRLCVVASSPEAAKELLKLQDANFCSRPPLRAAQLILPKGTNFATPSHCMYMAYGVAHVRRSYVWYCACS